METRYIFIGDIHGCFDELIHLLDVVSPSSNDRIISLGDFLDRGPSALKCVELWRDKGYLAVLGNHDDRIVKWANGVDVPSAEGFVETKKEFEDRLDLINYISELPNVLYFSEIGSAAVHAALDVNNQSLDVDPEIALRGRFVRTTPEGKFKYLELGKENVTDNLWVRYWKSDITVFYGHTPTRDSTPLVINNTVGLDTSCAYGRNLTAGIVTNSGQLTFVSVPAKKKYWEKAKKEEIVVI